MQKKNIQNKFETARENRKIDKQKNETLKKEVKEAYDEEYKKGRIKEAKTRGYQEGKDHKPFSHKIKNFTNNPTQQSHKNNRRSNNRSNTGLVNSVESLNRIFAPEGNTNTLENLANITSPSQNNMLNNIPNFTTTSTTNTLDHLETITTTKRKHKKPVNINDQISNIIGNNFGIPTNTPKPKKQKKQYNPEGDPNYALKTAYIQGVNDTKKQYRKKKKQQKNPFDLF